MRSDFRGIGMVCIVVTALFYTGCSNPQMPETLGSLGKFLQVNSAGHFLSTIVYENTDGKFTYNADGTFEQVKYGYEWTDVDLDGDGNNGEGWVTANGYRGTYAYSSKVFMMTYSVSHSLQKGEWVAEPNQFFWTEEQFFTEHAFGLVYKKGSGDRWVSRYFESCSYPTEDPDFTVVTTWEGLSGYIVNPDTIVAFNTGVYPDVPIVMDENEYHYDILTMKPDGIRFQEGETVTFHLRETVYRIRFRPRQSEDMPDWTEVRYQNAVSLVLIHMGDYIVKYNPALTRGF